MSLSLTVQMTEALDITALVSMISAGVPALLFGTNFVIFRRPGMGWNRRPLPKLSVLIPARNEEQSIEAAVRSVLASRGVELELIVLDDASTDRTAELVLAIAESDLRVRLEAAPELPDGWNGKQHACWVLASKATTEVFCFLDADVRLGTEALYRMLSELQYSQAERPDRALVSGFPKQETVTWLEWLLLPLIHFVLLGFLPLVGERLTGRVGFAAGCGQFLMVRKEPYFASGGHSGIPATMHDGLLLPKLFRRNGFRTAVYDLSKDASCRMYCNAGEVWRGLSKNATEGMATWLRLPFFTVLQVAGQVLPLPLLIVSAYALDRSAFRFAFLALFAGYAMRVVSAKRYGQDWRSVVVHPVGVLVMLLLQWTALLGKLVGVKATWKERAYRVG
jgi:glycosyltransferase involved in cell wall biosynthesis